jgi:hypothetical protein
MTLDYDMEYITGNERRREVCRIHAENDEDAVIKSKEKFLEFAEFNHLSSNSSLTRVYRAPENLINKVYGFSTTEEKRKYSLDD